MDAVHLIFNGTMDYCKFFFITLLKRTLDISRKGFGLASQTTTQIQANTMTVLAKDIRLS